MGMNISTKGRYGMRILYDIAVHDDGKRRLMKDIAESQGISEKYISRLMISLRKAGLVRSVRGAKGGYRLGRDPSQISILEVVEAMEGRVCIVDCVGSSITCPKTQTCPTNGLWARLNREIRASMGKVTLSEVIEQYRGCAPSGIFGDYSI